MCTHLVILMISKTSNISSNRSRVKVMAVGKHSPIYMFDIQNFGIIAYECTCNGRRGRLLFKRLGRVSTEMGGAV